MQAVVFSLYLVVKRGGGGAWSEVFLAETLETGHKNLVDVLHNSARYSTILKGKNVSNVLANGEAQVNALTASCYSFICGDEVFRFLLTYEPDIANSATHARVDL